MCNDFEWSPLESVHYQKLGSLHFSTCPVKRKTFFPFQHFSQIDTVSNL